MEFIYVVLGVAVAIGLLTIHAPNIEAWCDKKMAKKPRK